MATGLTAPYVYVGIAFASNPLDSPQVWTDITPYVQTIDTFTGRQHELNRVEAGTCIVLADNRDGRFDPDNSSSPYAPNVLVARRLRVQASWNLLTANQASLETNTTGWAALTNCAISQGSVGLDGTHGLRMTSTAGGDMSATTPTGTSGFVANPGTTYSLMGFPRSVVSVRACSVGVAWYNAAGAQIGSTTFGSTVNDATGSFPASGSQPVLNATAPALAAFGALVVKVAATGAGSEVHDWDELGVFPANSITAWDAGGVVDIWQGFIEKYEELWPDVSSADVKIHCSGFLKILNLFTLLAPYPATVLKDAPTGYYRLNDPTGSTVAIDSSGNNNPGSYVGTLTFGVTSPIQDSTAKAITDPSASNGIQTTVATPGTGPFSVEFWINGAPPAGIASQDVAGAAFTYSSGGGGSLRFTVPGISNASISPALGGGVWHHVVGTWDGTTSKVYVDTVLGGTTGTGTETSRSSVPWSLGVGSNIGASYTELAIYNGTALSTARVSAHYAAGLTAWANDLSGTRIGRVLDAVGVAAGDRSLDAGLSTIQALTTGAGALSLCQDVSNTENGLFFENPSGGLSFYQRDHVIVTPSSKTSQATFGNNGTTELPCNPGTAPGTDDLDLWTGAQVARTNGLIANNLNAAAGVTFVQRILVPSAYINTSDLECVAAAQWLTNRYAHQQSRIASLSFKPYSSPGLMYPQALRRRLWDRITLNWTRPGRVGPRFTLVALIEGISQHYEKQKSWQTTYALSPADTTAYMIWDDPVYGFWDQGLDWSY